MTWLSVTIVDDDFSIEGQAFFVDGSPYFFPIGSGRRVFHVKSDTPFFPSDQALLARKDSTFINSIGDSYSADHPYALCNRIAVTKRMGPCDAEVTCDFHDPTGGSTFEVLLGTPAKIVSSTATQPEQYTKDCDDPPKPVRNSAGEPYDNPPTRQQGGRIYTVEKYVDAGIRAFVRSIEQTNNSKTLFMDGFIHPENTLVLEGATFEPVQSFWKMTMVIHYNPQGWVDKAPDVGFTQIITDPDSGARIRVDISQQDKDGNWVPVTKPWPLYPDGSSKDEPDDDIDFLDFFPYPESDWTGIPVT
jgi:hypothetical protein